MYPDPLPIAPSPNSAIEVSLAELGWRWIYNTTQMQASSRKEIYRSLSAPKLKEKNYSIL